MKSKIILLLIFTLFSFILKAQVYTYYLNNDLGSVSKAEATILGKGSKKNNLFELDCYSITGNQLYLTFHFKDSTLATLEGPFKSFYPDRQVEESGSYSDNMKEGLWQKWDSTGRKTDSAIYKNNLEIFVAHFDYYENNKLSFKSFKDSLANTLMSFSYDTNSVLTRQAEFVGNKGILKTYGPAGISMDSVFTREEKEAEAKGGAAGWLSYIKKNMDPLIPVKNNAPYGIYKLVIRFVILPDGSISDVEAETKYGYGMEKEAIRLIKNGPKWTPAMQYGRPVKAYRRQPLTFVVQNSG